MKVYDELVKFLAYYSNIDTELKNEKNPWNFRGLINAISKNKNIDHSTKTILRNLIDLLSGYKDSYIILTQISEENIEKVDKMKRNRKIKQTIIISGFIVAAFALIVPFILDVLLQSPCSLSNSLIMQTGNHPMGIDFNPITKQAYIANEKDKTISIIDCKIRKVDKFIKQYIWWKYQI